MSESAGPPSPTLSLPAAPADSAQHAMSQQQRAASSMAVSSVPGSLGGPAFSYGGIPPPLSSTRRQRNDLGSGFTPQRRRRLSLPEVSGISEAASEPMSEEGGEDQHNMFVWGTNLVISDIQNRIRRFMRNYTPPDSSEALYTTLIQQALKDEDVHLNVDLMHMFAYDPELYEQLVAYPGEVIPLLDVEAREIAEDLHGEPLPENQLLTVRPFNLREHKVIRDLDPSDANRLISVSGMVTRTSGIIPDSRAAIFQCAACGHEVLKYNVGGAIEEPAKCPEVSCGKTWTMQLMHNYSDYNDKQLVKMQENPNSIPEGETPHSVTLFGHDHLVDMAKPGDRITLTGIYKMEGVRVNPRIRMLRSIYKTFIDAIHIAMEERSPLFSVKTGAAPEDNTMLSQETPPDSEQVPMMLGTESAEQLEAKEEELRALGADPDIYEKLTASLAPSIWQLDDVKKGILCQLFGGTTKEWSGGRVRGEINILLVGDPGVSKSQLLGYVNKIAPRGIYTSGRGSSAVGLTAYVSKDAETKEMVLESGALVLSDCGVCCIDEFDKMSDSSRSMLHEVMEQQTVSVAKAGIIASLNARTSVLASANPVGSRYNPRMSVIDNIQLPPSLLSRFDLIYLVLDKINEQTDRKLARHLIALYHEKEPVASQAVIPINTLRDYIAYARLKCQPELTEEAGQDLVNSYLDMRQQGISRSTISATPRQLESMVRLSEALARMRLSPTVNRQDVAEATRLMKVAMQQSATDPTTGTIDMDSILTGMSAADRQAQNHLSTEILVLLKKTRSPLSAQDIVEKMNVQASVPVGLHQVQEAIKTLSDELTRVAGGKLQHKNALDV